MKCFIYTFIALFMSATAANTAPAPVPWLDLVDKESQAYEDPYRDLEPGQLNELITVVRLRQRLENATDANRDMLASRLSRHEAELAQAGIDIDWLISQRWAVAERRRKAATAGNGALDGQQITIAGYTIPAPASSDGTQYVYLVPERGMCSHMPPPNPNQMIRIRSAEEQLPQLIYTPVRVTGQLAIDPSSERIYIVDGPQEMRATFALDLKSVEVFGNAAVVNLPNHGSNPFQKRRPSPQPTE